MKKLLLIFSVIITFRAEAQDILRDQGKYGLSDGNGKQLLPYEYDGITALRQFGDRPRFYVLRQGKQFGLYTTIDNKSTGCIYDSVYLLYNLIYLRKGDDLGYVAQTSLAYSIVPPQFTYLFPMCESAALPVKAMLSMFDYALSAKTDSMWGVVSFADGHTVLPFHFRNEVTQCGGDEIWSSRDRNSGEMLLINPYTGSEFKCTIHSKHQLEGPESRYLMIYNHDRVLPDDVNVSVWDYASGQLLWTFTSKAYVNKAVFVTETIVLVTEEVPPTEPLRNNEKRIFTFFNITNGSPLLTYTGSEDSGIETVHLDNRIVVYASENYNGRKKEIGQIFK